MCTPLTGPPHFLPSVEVWPMRVTSKSLRRERRVWLRYLISQLVPWKVAVGWLLPATKIIAIKQPSLTGVATHNESQESLTCTPYVLVVLIAPTAIIFKVLHYLLWFSYPFHTCVSSSNVKLSLNYLI